MNVLRPASLEEAVRMMAEAAHPLTPIAGGTDLMVSWHHRPRDELDLLDLSRLSAELSGLRQSSDCIEIGALATYWDVIRSEMVARSLPLLARAARQVGAMQIQTRGTWAGNIGNGSPAADGVPVLMAYDATVVLHSRAGRREVPLDGYYTGYRRSVRRPDELIVAIRVPMRRRDFEYWHKVGSRAAQTITKVGVAMARDSNGWRVVANSVAPTVVRCRRTEAVLEGGHVFRSAREVRDVVARDVSPIDDLRSTAAYRLTVLSKLIFSALAARQTNA